MNYLQKKKLAFMSIVSHVKGFVRTIIGALPLTLEGCVDENSIIDYKMYGQGVQDGEPTPDNPIEVESVGEKTKNLINWDYLLDDTGITKVDNGYYSEVYYHSFGATSNLVKQLKSVLKSDTTYTLSRICDKTKDGAAVGSVRINVGGNTFVNTGYWKGLKSVTFTITQEQIDNITSVLVYFNSGGEDATISEIQLTESDTVLPYEPYGKYKIPVTVSGRNLFDIDTYGEALVIKGHAAALDISKFDVGTVITISTKDEYYYKIAESAGGAGAYQYKSNNYTFTLTQTHINLGYIFLISPKTWKSETKENLLLQNVQIEYGSIATPYEPYHEPITTNIYLDEPLRKVGDYADYVDFEGGKVVRKVGVGDLTTVTDPWIGLGSTPNQNGYYTNYYLTNTLVDGVMLRGDNLRGCSNFLPCNTTTTGWNTWNSEQVRFGQSGSAVYIITANQMATKADLRNYISNNGAFTPYIYYILETPTEQPITLPTIPTFKGTSIVSVDTTIQPSNAEIEYYSNVKE